MQNKTSTLDKFKSAVQAYNDVHNAYERIKNWHEKRTTWTIEVTENDKSFRLVQDWLLTQIPERDHKYLKAVTDRRSVDSDALDNDDNWDLDIIKGTTKFQNVLRLSLNDNLNEILNIEGHAVAVSVGKQAPRPPRKFSGGIGDLLDSAEDEGRYTQLGPQRIMFRSRSIQGNQAVIRLLDSLIKTNSDIKPSLYVADSWGSWRRQDIPLRPMDSVVLKDGLADSLTMDLHKFLRSESRYVNAGTPWRRGYLLYGPPGTGKSSIIKGLASELGLDLWYLPFGDVKAEDKFHQLISSVGSGILLLEDVDEFAAARTRTDVTDGNDDKAVTASGLLNVLDGVSTPHGLIVIMTTNHPERLDGALTRAGRLDMRVEVGLPDWDIVSRLWDKFFPEKMGVLNAYSGIDVQASRPGTSQADVCELYKRNWDDPEAALESLSNWMGFEAQK